MPNKPDLCYDLPDRAQFILLGRLSGAQRVRAMLDARELAVGLKRGRLRRRYPRLSEAEINLKLLEELARADQREARS